ncbi:MAG TPA: photosystem reaction center subunit H [Halobacteriales archaeon]|uniref:PRC-barrel domain-containing protein n=1 Tax=Candidatus Hikarchaeum yamanae TaxID=2675326 RepID=UPI00183303DC|nr:photosystem reaction center subunit H [Halobacteriales archaeon]|tara:strand:+ start:7415 stop:7705 length:291 start_codon:yes stop_codon:yes gene_type:complete
MESATQEINKLIGREVYSKNGIFVGEVDDVQISIDNESITGLAVSSVNLELFKGWDLNGKGILVPYRWVRSVGDIVLVNDIVERVAVKESDETATG